MKEDIINVKDAVHHCLGEDRRCRNSDKWLIIKVLNHMGFNIFIPFDKLDIMPSFESITRSRRLIQAKGIYLADDDTRNNRRAEYEEMVQINRWSS